ncbi:MAG: hypothetical protein GF344_12625 [Chitinivibrionales bacterium]|nr:hypothetical protein [Chitinivibrionales bacterium]MBD3357597.1 hypothetical protein [Chitinivibrionales bacterium]
MASVKSAGYTLLEVTVVAIIILLLGSIAIPMYKGYLTDAKRNAARDLARTASTAANAYYRKTGNASPSVAMLNLNYDTTQMEIMREDSLIIVRVKGTEPILADTVAFR